MHEFQSYRNAVSGRGVIGRKRLAAILRPGPPVILVEPGKHGKISVRFAEERSFSVTDIIW
ncbi:MAG: hypothetical protein R3C19_15190 [Planctomycetaceae bacterium]